MKCPNCGLDNNEITDSRKVGCVVRRRRYCLLCYVGDTSDGVRRIERLKHQEALSHGKRDALSVPHLKNRQRPVWIGGQINGWAIINDYDGGDFYVYTRDGGIWLDGRECRKKWFAYEDVRLQRRAYAKNGNLYDSVNLDDYNRGDYS